MKKIVFPVLLFFLGLHACQNNVAYQYYEGYAEGTTYHIYYQSNTVYDNEIDSLLGYFEDILSTYDSTSLISYFNQHVKDTFETDNVLFWNMVNTAADIYKETNGAFDITVAPLVNAYGFGVTDTLETDSTLIDSLLQYVGMDKLIIDGNKLIKTNPNIQIDGNAIAKGQSVDFVTRFFEDKGVDNYLVEIGGELRGKGVNKYGEPWQIGIDNPNDNNTNTETSAVAIMGLSNSALATSGNYRRFYYKNGLRYSHTINPKTGYPVNYTLLSSSVMTNKCITADAYATSFMVMGFAQSKAFLKTHPNIDVYFIYGKKDNGYDIFSTEKFKGLIKSLTN